MLQPVVERKGCEKVLGDMRDCLVETHCWGKCDEEVQRFQECINTKYFEEIVVEPDVESGEESLELEGVVTIDEVKSEGVVSTSDESGNAFIDGDVKTNEEPMVTEELKTNEEEPVVNEENTEDDLLDSNVDVNNLQDEKQEEQTVNTDDNAELVDDKEVEVPNDSDISKDDETNTVDKDAFRIRIVSKSEKKVEEDENLLFRVTVKPNV